jgi:hypothetical protein
MAAGPACAKEAATLDLSLLRQWEQESLSVAQGSVETLRQLDKAGAQFLGCPLPDGKRLVVRGDPLPILYMDRNRLVSWNSRKLGLGSDTDELLYPLGSADRVTCGVVVEKKQGKWVVVEFRDESFMKRVQGATFLLEVTALDLSFSGTIHRTKGVLLTPLSSSPKLGLARGQQKQAVQIVADLIAAL